MTWIWSLLLVAAALWPGRLSGPLDGVPLDRLGECVLVGMVLPALWWFHTRFLTTRLARSCIVVLLAWKALTAATLVQDGWCIRLSPALPYVKDGTGAPHSWDVRADWRAPDPRCTAIMTRGYDELNEFPAWFFNLTPPRDDWPGPKDLPPGATVSMTVRGFLTTRQPGVLDIATGVDVVANLSADGRLLWRDNVAQNDTSLGRGTHRIAIDGTLTGNLWQLRPRWRDEDVWSAAIATVQRPSPLDLVVRPWARWVTPTILGLLIAAWVLSFLRTIHSGMAIAWLVAASVLLGTLARSNGGTARWAIAGLFAAAALHVPQRLRNVRGAFLLVGIPWLTFIVVSSVPAIGRFRLYEWGNDYWTFQRYAYRIVMQGYWLEGGSPTFWFQPLYRWIAGALHLVFGDSSVGETYWDATCVLVSALFAFYVTKAAAGFRWGLMAAATSLTVFALGTTGRFVGLGLSEISSAGLIYLGAFFVLRSRHRRLHTAIAAGMLVTLGFYTRLNNLPMALGTMAFAAPLVLPASALWRPGTWRSRVSWRVPAVVSATLCLGLLLFAWRTWHYTGMFSVWYGTQAGSLSVWQPGVSLAVTLQRAAESLLMVLSMNDPPRFDLFALPLLVGAGISVLALIGVPGIRALPLAPVLFCLATLSGSLVARGSAYAGRFSIHAIGISCAIATCGVANILRLARMPHGTVRWLEHAKAAWTGNETR